LKLRVATCQFPVSADIDANARYVRRQLRSARQRGARVAHFCEGALSGYAGVDFASHAGLDWERLERRAREIAELAGELGIWVVLGSSHRLTGRRKPHNSVYVIDERGRLVDRYDKRFCAGDRSGRSGELVHYSPGDHFSVFEIGGVRCGVLICHEYRYPELYRAYRRRGVELVFHSYHAGNVSPRTRALLRRQVGERHCRLNRGASLPEITMPAAMQAAAACSHVWISASNTSAPESCWPAFFVRPDGVITGRLRRNRAGVLLSSVDTKARLYDGSGAWRERAMRGVLHSGIPVRDDPRSHDRKAF
jgi:predicted amidohydrolase